MRTIALALFAAAAKAFDQDALNQQWCDGYLWGLGLEGWTCSQHDTVLTRWNCSNFD